MTEQQPTVGRIVHVVSDRGECQAAIITAHGVTVGPRNGELAVTVFPLHASPYPQRAVRYYSSGGAINPSDTWHWPERAN